jgi:hypothetical protein
MKKIVIIIIAGLLIVSLNVNASGAMGSSFGCLTTATPLGMGKGNLGGGVGIADGNSAFGSFTYGLSKYTDGRLRLGLMDNGLDTRLTIGADFKWQFWNVGQNRNEPIDMALGGFFEYLDLGSISVFEFGGQVIGSYPFQLKNGGSLSPYGRFNIRLESNSPKVGNSETKLKFGLNAGVCWKATETIGLYGEFQFDGNDGAFFGIDFNVL